LGRPAPAGGVVSCLGLAATRCGGLRLGGNLFDTATNYSGAPSAPRTVPTSTSEPGGGIPRWLQPRSDNTVAMTGEFHTARIAHRRSRRKRRLTVGSPFARRPGMFKRPSGPSPRACLTLDETNATIRACRRRTSEHEREKIRLRADAGRSRVGRKRSPRLGPRVRFCAEQAALPFPAGWPGHRLNGADPLRRRLLPPEVKATLRRARPALLEEP